MYNRRTFIKQFAAVGVLGCMPAAVFSEGDSDRSIQLLVRGDDLGKNFGRTSGIIKAYKEGIITSASIMPTSAYFEEAARLCKENAKLTVGIHIAVLDGTQRPVLSPDEVSSIITPLGYFYDNAEQLERASPNTEEIEKEIRAQLEKARKSGIEFCYMEPHRGVPGFVRDMVIRICREQKLLFGDPVDGSLYGFTQIKLMQESWPNTEMPDGQIIYYAPPPFDLQKQQFFFDALNSLKPGRWMTAVHPGIGEPERESVTELLCSAEAKKIIQEKNIKLISYYDLWKSEFGK